MANKDGCKYCVTDRDGYSTYLPRIGRGNAHIRQSTIHGWVIDVSLPYKNCLTLKINNCPMCGRDFSEKQSKEICEFEI